MVFNSSINLVKVVGCHDEDDIGAMDDGFEACLSCLR
jgi:hypothetical protein